jgi:hypothetical protein
MGKQKEGNNEEESVSSESQKSNITFAAKKKHIEKKSKSIKTESQQLEEDFKRMDLGIEDMPKLNIKKPEKSSMNNENLIKKEKSPEKEI